MPYQPELSFEKQVDLNTFGTRIQPREWQPLWTALTGYTGGGLQQHWSDTINRLQTANQVSLPDTRLIPAIRQIGARGGQFSDYSGGGLIDRLAEIQSPDHDKRVERNIFDRINHFLQTVTGKPSAQIEIPHNREHILVHMDQKILPLWALGTGIHEVIMIAAFCTVSEQKIVCIEEPELHLHPLLQRKLVAYLQENTENQYFVATHSASFIDTPEAAIFHVKNDGGQTSISESILRRDRFAICLDLGHRASDLVQSNAVIWVEGPSDQIYLRHWIKAMAPELVEGIHYSIMFYGGRLLNHLTADDDEVTEFISLRGLNQNLAVVMDSDRSGPKAAVNKTKLRVQSEFQSGPGIAWITKGREIENYVRAEVIQAVVKRLHASVYPRLSG